MTNKPTIQNMTSFQAAFDFFNQELFGNSLPQVILNFSRSGSSTIAFYAPKRWAQEGRLVDQDSLDEISLNPIHLGRTMEEIFSSLVHEMVHLWQFAQGSPSRRSYHNKEWASKMKEVGLQPNDGTGKETGQKVSHTIIAEGRFQMAFQAMPESHGLPWRVFVEGDHNDGGEAGKKSPVTKSKGKSGKRFKYSCPECQTNIWGKEGLRVLCGECEVEFQPACK